MIFGNVKNNGDMTLSYIPMMTTDHIIVPDLTHGKNKISELLSMMWYFNLYLKENQLIL